MSEPSESSFNINIDLPTGQQFPYLCCLFCNKYFSTPDELLEHENSDKAHKQIVNEKLERMHQFNDYFGNNADREAIERRRRRKLEEQMQQARRTPSTSTFQRYAIDANTGRVCDEGSSRRILVPTESAKRKRDEDSAPKKETPKRTRIELTYAGSERDIQVQSPKKPEKPEAVKSSTPGKSTADTSKVKPKEPQPSSSAVSKAPPIKQKSSSEERLAKSQPSTSDVSKTSPTKRKSSSKDTIAKPQPSSNGVSKTPPTKQKSTGEEKASKQAVKRSIESTESTSKKSKKQDQKSTETPEKAQASDSTSSEFTRKWRIPIFDILEKPKHSPSKKNIEILDTSWIRTGKLGLTIDKLKYKPAPPNTIQMTREEFEKIESTPEAKTTPTMDYYRKQPWFINSKPSTSGLSGKSKTSSDQPSTSGTSLKHHKRSQSDDPPKANQTEGGSCKKTSQSKTTNQDNKSRSEKHKTTVMPSTSKIEEPSQTELKKSEADKTTNVLTTEGDFKPNTSKSRLENYDTSFRDMEERPPRPLEWRIKLARFLFKIQSRSRRRRRLLTILRRRSWP